MEKAIVFAEKSALQKKVFCQLCKNVYRRPFIASCGHTFCQECVSERNESIKCPIDGSKLSLLVKNLAVEEEVADLDIHCHFGCMKNDEGFCVNPEGCPEVIKLGKRDEHEINCKFAFTECPNGCQCSPIFRKDLEEHLANCHYHRCLNHKYRCTFKGTQEQVEKHMKTCHFDGLRGAVGKLEGDFAAICETVNNHSEGLKELTSSFHQNTNQLEDLKSATRKTVQKISRLEEQQVLILKEMTLLKDNITSILNELKGVQQQTGTSPFTSNTPGNMISIETQHLFKCQGTFVGHQGPIWDLCKNKSFLYSASSDNTIKVWNLTDIYAGPQTLTGHDGIILALCCQGHKLFSGSSDTYIRVWNTKSNEVITSVKAHEDPVCTLTCNDSYLFSGSLRSIKVWDISSHELRSSLPTQNHWVRALIVRGKLLYSGSYKAIKIWNIDTLNVVHVLQCMSGSVYSIAVTDKYIIGGTYENTIHVWNASDHQEIGTLRGHVGSVYALAVLSTPGRIRLFSGSYDKTIRVWNLELFTCAQILARHEGSVTCLLNIGGSIVSGAVDSSLKVWK